MSTHHSPTSDKLDHIVLPNDPIAGAKYIAAMARELQLVASRSQLGMMSYLLDMLILEADMVIRGESSGKK